MKAGWLVLGILFCALGASAQVITGQAVQFFQPPIEGSDYNAGYTTTQDSQNAEGGSPVMFFGGTAPYTCSITSGSLPTGMSLKTVVPTGGYPSVICPIYGTPSVSGDFTITIKVTDSLSNTASQSVTFPVMDDTTARTNCTPSSVAAGSLTSSSATITWTTTNACNSVVYTGFGGYGEHVTADPTGVTSHSVNLSNLESQSSGSCPQTTGCGIYAPSIKSCGIVGGAPADYLCEFYNVNNQNGYSFRTTTGASAGTASFTIDLRGANDVIQGYPLIVQVYQSCLSGCSDYTGSGHSLKFQLTGIPSNSQVHWPASQDYPSGSLGYNYCAVSTTTTTNDTCSYSSEGTYPAVQFEVLTNQGGTTPTGSYTLTLTATAGTTPTVVSTNWTLNVEPVPTVPNLHPGAQPAVPGFSTWLSNLTTYGPYWYVTYNSGACAVPVNGPGFYDGTMVSERAYQYTGISTWNTAAANCEAGYYSYATSSWNVQAIYVFPEGLFYRCVVLNDATACSGVSTLPTKAGGNNLGSPYADAQYARESSWMLNAKRLDYDNGGATTLIQVKNLVTMVIGNIDQFLNESPNQESFMAGLMCQSLIDYQLDPHTGNNSDPRIYDIVKKVWDYSMANWWVPWAGTNGGFIYSTQSAVEANNLLFSFPQTGNSVLEDLNPLNASAAAYINAVNGGGTTYQQQGDTVEYDGIVEPVGQGVNYFGKTFTQDYRNSFSYMRWRGEANMPCTELGGSTSAGSGTAQNCSLDPATSAAPVLPPLNLGLAVQ
jgi:hypothetical protein